MKLLTRIPTVPMTNLFERRHPKVGCAGGSMGDDSDCLRAMGEASSEGETDAMLDVSPMTRISSSRSQSKVRSQAHCRHRTTKRDETKV